MSVAAPRPAQPTPTPSLRRRVIVMVLGLLVVLLLALGLTIDALMGVQVRRDLHDRLMATTARADALAAANTAPDRLIAQLGGGGVRALLITSQGGRYGDRAINPDAVAGATVPPPPPPPPPPPLLGTATAPAAEGPAAGRHGDRDRSPSQRRGPDRPGRRHHREHDADPAAARNHGHRRVAHSDSRCAADDRDHRRRLAATRPTHRTCSRNHYRRSRANGSSRNIPKLNSAALQQLSMACWTP